MAIYKGLTRLRDASYGKSPVAFINWGINEIWRFIKGFVYTNDGRTIKFNDGRFLKFKDQ